LDTDKPPHVQQLYDEADRLYGPMNEAYNRIVETPCRTLGDAVARLELSQGEGEIPDDEVFDYLRNIAAREGCQTAWHRDHAV
jgi:hypothetical protein